MILHCVGPDALTRSGPVKAVRSCAHTALIPRTKYFSVRPSRSVNKYITVKPQIGGVTSTYTHLLPLLLPILPAPLITKIQILTVIVLFSKSKHSPSSTLLCTIHITLSYKLQNYNLSHRAKKYSDHIFAYV